ncbi:MAG: hypothetical protein GC157_04325 [Frankiales bacterium]|nr:hypothetical protein [Frankiales bacterium]
MSPGRENSETLTSPSENSWWVTAALDTVPAGAWLESSSWRPPGSASGQAQPERRAWASPPASSWRHGSGVTDGGTTAVPEPMRTEVNPLRSRTAPCASSSSRRSRSPVAWSSQ